MNKNQIEDIKTRVANIDKLDLDNIISFIFKDQDIDSIVIGQFFVPEYVSTVKRLVKQFLNEFEVNGHFLPSQYNYQNEFGNGNLQNDIQSLHNHINTKNHQNLNNSIGFINRLVYYQIDNGFWEKSTRKIHKASEIKITKLNDQLNYISTQLKENGVSFKELLVDLNDKKDNLQKFIIQKNQELQQVTNNLQTSNSNTNQISQLLTNSTATSEKINGLQKQQDQNVQNALEKVVQLDEFLKDRKITFKEIEEIQNDKVEVIEKQIKTFTKNLEFVESKTDFFKERNDYLDELIGREVGASLFETFKQRKGELEKPISKWFFIVIAMAILTFCAILVIFTNAFGLLGEIPAEISTIRLITNSIKTLPFFFLLFYAIAQYNKERNFQEEYAFKSSVALTIKAYSDIISKEELKDELIVKSVSGIYKSPTIYKTKKNKEDNTILDTAKDLLGTALEVLKKK
jgi:hypothetical protein